MITSTLLSKHTTIDENSFGLIRLIAASMVIVSHAWTITGGLKTPEPLQSITGFSLGWHAVNIFFSLSGLLVAASLANSNSALQFIWARFLRIYPALIVVILSTLIISALSVNIEAWQSLDVAKYIIQNILLIGASATLPNVFENNPLAGEINIPLWTLKYEVTAYASLVGIFLTCKLLPKLPSLKYLSLVILFITAVIMLKSSKMIEYSALEHFTRLIFAFYLGVAGWHWREKTSVNLSFAIILLALNAIVIWSGTYYAGLQVLAFSYLALFIGIQNYGWITRFTNRQDYSYGIYIIGYPVQQLLVALSITQAPELNAFYAILISLLISAILWNLIEKPALRFKKHSIVKGIKRLTKRGSFFQ